MTGKEIFQNLEKCVVSLEDEVKRSYQEIAKKTFDAIVSESDNDYHYQEIFNHLKAIKTHIKEILKNDKSIKRESKIDKDYIKKQVEVFQSCGQQQNIPVMRGKKTNRQSDNCSMKYLETWEKFLDQKEVHNIDFADLVKKRPEDNKRKKKVISSTIDMFLEVEPKYTNQLNEIDENFEDIITTQEEEGKRKDDDGRELTKPRIVDVIYKKPPL